MWNMYNMAAYKHMFNNWIVLWNLSTQKLEFSFWVSICYKAIQLLTMYGGKLLAFYIVIFLFCVREYQDQLELRDKLVTEEKR